LRAANLLLRVFALVRDRLSEFRRALADPPIRASVKRTSPRAVEGDCKLLVSDGLAAYWFTRFVPGFQAAYLLIPEPRDINMGGEVVVGYSGGRSEAWNEYGHRPWEKGYKDDKRFAKESAALERFKAEWSVMQGPAYRGTSFEFRHKDQDTPYVMPDESHQHYLDRAKQYQKRQK
jgi:hypothetical protein